MKRIYSLALIFFLAGCRFLPADRAFPPVIVNEEKTSIEITVSFEDGTTQSQLVLESRVDFWQRAKHKKIVGLRIKEPAGKGVVYSSDDFSKLRAVNGSEFEVWSISEAGLRLLNHQQFEKLYRAKISKQ
jgi:hypothetical protein